MMGSVPEGESRVEQALTVRRYRCPTATRRPDGRPHEEIGCGSWNTQGPDWEGLYDCLLCGLWFDPAVEPRNMESRLETPEFRAVQEREAARAAAKADKEARRRAPVATDAQRPRHRNHGGRR